MPHRSLPRPLRSPSTEFRKLLGCSGLCPLHPPLLPGVPISSPPKPDLRNHPFRVLAFAFWFRTPNGLPNCSPNAPAFTSSDICTRHAPHLGHQFPLPILGKVLFLWQGLNPSALLPLLALRSPQPGARAHGVVRRGQQAMARLRMGGVHVRRPRVRPLFRPGAAAGVRPLGAHPASKLRTAARLRAAPRLRTQTGHAAVPPPGGNPAQLLVRAEERTTWPPMRRPRSGRGLGRPTRGRGRAGRPPHGDVRPGSRRVAMEAAFPSLRASGGRPLPFNFFLNGGRGRCRAVPAPCDSAAPAYSGPRFTFPCCPRPRGLACCLSGRCTPLAGHLSTQPPPQVCAFQARAVGRG
ncbi:uncharacterized protein LOC132518764 isoform X1 [Lagenorhynchus albirostris]|uniref:uncharacterized protein LOC132518764 isoform X1 n=1 Tax=Lagenorhynchus albirostris TaxID=27610 RepID=UPI0028E9ED04|nr:uncharacterized protein LOC132518764 isoform X1 [Lagenorhynchus albirostris]XP_060002758.1 uncharacterized protein LOC132518764 isoform X1 [Lagenorhynchus albirostris]XP_060002759.1 uncharacterized protein LOC132518764 isoform X1 [Lagenorhynchus albirostris]